MQDKLEPASTSVSFSFVDLRPEDFDGHTEFATMSPEQRLTWLSQVARFTFLARDSRESRIGRAIAD